MKRHSHGMHQRIANKLSVQTKTKNVQRFSSSSCFNRLYPIIINILEKNDGNSSSSNSIDGSQYVTIGNALPLQLLLCIFIYFEPSFFKQKKTIIFSTIVIPCRDFVPFIKLQRKRRKNAMGFAVDAQCITLFLIIRLFFPSTFHFFTFSLSFSRFYSFSMLMKIFCIQSRRNVMNTWHVTLQLVFLTS